MGMVDDIKGVHALKKTILTALFILTNNSVNAQINQSLDLLKSKIEQHVINELSSYTEGRVKVSADKIDSRLNLKACADDQLAIFNPYQMPMLNTNTLGIKCQEETNHWTLYVPIRITVLKTVLVAKHPLIKGSHLNADDFYQTELDVQKLKQGYFIDAQAIIGQVCKQNINADSPLNPYNVELAKLVNRGDQVTITATNNALTISMDGVAITEGALGEPVKVKNLSSKRIIEAQVSGVKKVTITL